MSGSQAFLGLDAHARLAALLDDAVEREECTQAGEAICTVGRVAGRHAAIGALGPGRAVGAIGAAEAGALARLADRARTQGLPLLLLLDSAGARLDGGLASLGGFVGLYRAVLAARAAGSPVVAVIGRNAFGGASMLASAAHARVWLAPGRFAMSGPGVIAHLGGTGELDAQDPAAVRDLIGASARAALDDAGMLVPDQAAAVRTAVQERLARVASASAAPAFETRHARLRDRLQHAGHTISHELRPAPVALRDRLGRVLGEGFECLLGEGVLRGVRTLGGAEASVAGLVAGAPATAVAAWMLAESIATSVKARPERPIVLACDSPGHATTRADEAVMLSDYIAHIALAVDHARGQGVAVYTLVLGASSGGLHAALAARATAVVAAPGADIRVLPRAAVAAVLGEGRAPPEEPPARWPVLGVADAVAAEDRAVAAAITDAAAARARAELPSH